MNLGFVEFIVIVFAAAVCLIVGFLIGRASVRKETMREIDSLHTQLSGIKKAEEVGVMFPEEYNVRVREIMKDFIRQNIPEKLAEVIEDYVNARIYLERLS